MSPLGVLFLFLAACLAGVTYAAARAGQWVIAAAAAVLAAWLAQSSFRLLSRRR